MSRVVNSALSGAFRNVACFQSIAVALIAVALTAGSSANAAVIANYTFDGNDYTSDPANTTGANNALNLSSSALAVVGYSVTDINFSPALDGSSALGFAADDYDGALGFSTDVNSARSIVTSGQTIYFNVNVAAGNSLSLDTLSFESLKTRGSNATGSRATHSIFVNPEGDPGFDGLVGDFDFLVSRAHDHLAVGEVGAESVGDSFTTGRWEAGPIDLSASQNLTGTIQIAIRLYSSDALDRDFGIDNLVLRGNLNVVNAVPEPMTPLALLTFVAGVARRRKASTTLTRKLHSNSEIAQ